MCVREPGPEDDLNEAAGSVPTASTAKAALYSGRCCTQPLGVAKIRKIGLKLWMACTPYSYSPASGFLTDYGGTGNKNKKTAYFKPEFLALKRPKREFMQKRDSK